MFLRVFLAIVVVALLFVGVRLFVRPYSVATDALSPCLKKGETLILDRCDLMSGKMPQRFEIVAIVPPYIDNKAYKPAQGLESMVAVVTGTSFAPDSMVDLRRVIGLPGETIVIRKDLGILIDGKLLDEHSYSKDKPNGDYFVLADLAKGSGNDDDQRRAYETGDAPIVVPDGCLFV